MLITQRSRVQIPPPLLGSPGQRPDRQRRSGLLELQGSTMAAESGRTEVHCLEASGPDRQQTASWAGTGGSSVIPLRRGTAWPGPAVPPRLKESICWRETGGRSRPTESSGAECPDMIEAWREHANWHARTDGDRRYAHDASVRKDHPDAQPDHVPPRAFDPSR